MSEVILLEERASHCLECYVAGVVTNLNPYKGAYGVHVLALLLAAVLFGIGELTEVAYFETGAGISAFCSGVAAVVGGRSLLQAYSLAGLKGGNIDSSRHEDSKAELRAWARIGGIGLMIGGGCMTVFSILWS